MKRPPPPFRLAMGWLGVVVASGALVRAGEEIAHRRWWWVAVMALAAVSSARSARWWFRAARTVTATVSELTLPARSEFKGGERCPCCGRYAPPGPPSGMSGQFLPGDPGYVEGGCSPLGTRSRTEGTE